MRIVEAESGPALADAALLFREYAASLPFSLCFQGFEHELATLPGRYARPAGRLFIAYDDANQPAGCIALRDISQQVNAANTCEMKRLYVRPQHRRAGLARSLCDLLLTEARAAGYTTMKLDTSSDMHPAITLYRSLGFTECERYNDDPMDDTLWFELKLLS
ncbi:MAG TPA: GNAT family N-acetyltransferase [Phycisphaerales bacterium]|nr:GNAT family N-acetyltransferase [Phycisphaerales bacterium]